jgi:hypothetical protein
MPSPGFARAQAQCSSAEETPFVTRMWSTSRGEGGLKWRVRNFKMEARMGLEPRGPLLWVRLVAGGSM